MKQPLRDFIRQQRKKLESESKTEYRGVPETFDELINPNTHQIQRVHWIGFDPETEYMIIEIMNPDGSITEDDLGKVFEFGIDSNRPFGFVSTKDEKKSGALQSFNFEQLVTIEITTYGSGDRRVKVI